MQAASRLVVTEGIENVVTTVERARRFPITMHLSGPPQTGKTICSQFVHNRFPYAFIDVTDVSGEPYPVMRQLMSQIGAVSYSQRPAVYEVERDLQFILCRDARNEEGRFPLVVIDNCQLLNRQALSWAVRLENRTGVSVLLVGNDPRLAITQQNKPMYGHLAGRIDEWLELPTPTATDCQKLAVSYNVAFDAHRIVEVIGTNTTIGLAAKVLETALRYQSGPGPITGDLLLRCLGKVMGKADVKRLMATALPKSTHQSALASDSSQS